jgi:hypothetical protein
MIKHKKVRCPHCGNKSVTSVSILLTKFSYPVIDIEIDTDLAPGHGDFTTLRVGPKCGEDTLDSAGNEHRLECSCGERWYPEVDEYDYEDDALADDRTEVWYQWKQYAAVEGYEEEGKRLLTPWADPNEYEHPWNVWHKTPEEAREAKAADAEADAEDWVLCKITMEPV